MGLSGPTKPKRRCPHHQADRYQIGDVGLEKLPPKQSRHQRDGDIDQKGQTKVDSRQRPSRKRRDQPGRVKPRTELVRDIGEEIINQKTRIDRPANNRINLPPTHLGIPVIGRKSGKKGSQQCEHNEPARCEMRAL
jgi:hypothetical protein